MLEIEAQHILCSKCQVWFSSDHRILIDDCVSLEWWSFSVIYGILLVAKPKLRFLCQSSSLDDEMHRLLPSSVSYIEEHVPWALHTVLYSRRVFKECCQNRVTSFHEDNSYLRACGWDSPLMTRWRGLRLWWRSCTCEKDPNLMMSYFSWLFLTLGSFEAIL